MQTIHGKQTKIVATIGPASDSNETIRALIEAGVNVFRFNMKHATVEWHHERIAKVQHIADEMGTPVGILIDLQGPEIRIETRDHADVPVAKGQHIVFAESLNTENVNVCIPHSLVFDVLEPGDEILIDDGFLEFKVVDKQPGQVTVESLGDYSIKHRKGVNLPGKHIDLPSLIDDDLAKLNMAGKSKVDFVALSFSRTRKDIDILRREMEERNVKAHIVAKIESQQAVDHLDELIEAADAVMVARGDLGIEVPIEELAYWQKTTITKCRLANKPVITATQMLQSMIDNPRPTRAEAVDVANAVFDGTDAVMLSAESASGKYPVRAVQYMARIAKHTEMVKENSSLNIVPENDTEYLVHAAIDLISSAKHPSLNAILVFTERGYAARVLAAYRPNLPIIAVSRHQKTVEQLTLSYGIHSYCIAFPKGTFSIPQRVFDELKAKGAIQSGQKVLVIHGKTWQEPGLTNALAILTIK